MIDTRKCILNAINTVLPLEDYVNNDFIFSEKYGISPSDMVYILLILSEEFKFKIDEEFVDALDKATFTDMERLLIEYGDTKMPN